MILNRVFKLQAFNHRVHETIHNDHNCDKYLKITFSSANEHLISFALRRACKILNWGDL